MVRAYRPKNLGEALKIRGETRAIPMAGGTDLMVHRKRWPGLAPLFERPLLFIDRLREIATVGSDAENVRIGACCRLSSLFENGEVPGILKTAISQMASPAIRNRATIGGNICNASPAGDTLPILYALDSSVVLESSNGSRTLPIDRFITGPGETALRHDELLKEILIPKGEFNTVSYRKVGTRAASSCAKLSFVGLAQRREKTVEDIRICFGAVAPTVVRSRPIEERLKGKNTGEIETMISEIRGLYSSLIQPIDDQRSNAYYRKTISLRLLDHFLVFGLQSTL